MKKDLIPPLTASCPRVGPITCCATIFAGASNLPEVKISAKSCACSMVKFPLISEFPHSIAPFTFGAL